MPIPEPIECPPHRRALLKVVRASDGGAEPDSVPPGTEYQLDRSPVVIGMSTTGLPDKRDIALYIGGLNRAHAYFELRGDGWWVCDNGSSGGTWVAGTKVTAKKLADRDRIALGAIGNPAADNADGLVLEFST